MSHVLLLRHPQSAHNSEGRWAGWIDSPLTTQGRGEACDAARRLAHSGYRGIASSDLSRASESALIISLLLRIPIVATDSRWRERNAGLWQGELVRTLDGPEYDSWRQDFTRPIPGGEDYQTFSQRISAALSSAQDWSRQWGPLIVVAHDGVQQSICQILELGDYPYPPLHGPIIPA